MMALNVNIEPILRSEAAWDVVNEPKVFPVIGLNHKFSFTTQHNPMMLEKAQQNEVSMSQSETGRSTYNTIAELIKAEKVKSAKVPACDLVLQKSGNKVVTGQVKATAFSEILSYQFLFDIVENDLKTLVEQDCMKEIIEYLLGTFQEQINADVLKFQLFVLGLVINIIFIHVVDGDCDQYVCFNQISNGRLNSWLLALRVCLGLFVLKIMKEEFQQLMKKESVWDYCTEV